MGGAPGGLKRLLDNADVSVLPSTPPPPNPPPPPPPPSPPSFSFRFFFLGVRKPSRSGAFQSNRPPYQGVESHLALGFV